MGDEMLESTGFVGGTECNLCTEPHCAASQTVCFRVARAYVRRIVKVLDGMGPCRAGPVHCTSPILNVLDPVLRRSSRGDRGPEKLWSPSSKSQNRRGAREEEMAHNHGIEYQIRTIREDGTEELCEWMNSEEQVAEAMAAVHMARRRAYWLRERNVLCPDCFEMEQHIIVECPITDIPTPRYGPHDSHYLVTV